MIRSLRCLIVVAALSAGATRLSAQETTAGECGNAPQVARASVLGRLYGLKLDPNPDSPWFVTIDVPQDSVVALTTMDQCLPVVAAALNGASTPDTLPLRGVVRLGHVGFVVVRGTEPSGPGQHSRSSTALLSPTLELRSYLRMQF